MSLINLKNINKEYATGEQKFHALRGISLEIEQGEFVAVTGASGSGKSTLMNLLGLLDRQTSGEYLLMGESVESFSERRLTALRNRTIGFIFQSFNLLPTLTAEENVELPLYYRKELKIASHERKIRVANALESVGLGAWRRHLPSQLSGGQKQRVAVARAIAMNPALILADEPTGNLDSVSTEAVMTLLKNLNKSGTTLVIITHDTEIARSAGRVISIRDGQIIN
jgi:putative ABC transport system ATP-binding protein